MPDLTILLLAFLGAYRLSHMIAMEDGPFDALAELRDRVGQGDWVGRGLHCVLCVSFWLSLSMAGWLAIAGLATWGVVWLVWLGLAGACLVLHKLLYRGA